MLGKLLFVLALSFHLTVSTTHLRGVRLLQNLQNGPSFASQFNTATTRMRRSKKDGKGKGKSAKKMDASRPTSVPSESPSVAVPSTVQPTSIPTSTKPTQVSASPSDSTATIFPFCAVCGTEKVVFDENAVFKFPGRSDTTCGELQIEGIQGMVNPNICPFLPLFAERDCGCRSAFTFPTIEPTFEPTSDPTRRPVLTLNPTTQIPTESQSPTFVTRSIPVLNFSVEAATTIIDSLSFHEATAAYLNVYFRARDSDFAEISISQVGANLSAMNVLECGGFAIYRTGSITTEAVVNAILVEALQEMKEAFQSFLDFVLANQAPQVVEITFETLPPVETIMPTSSPSSPSPFPNGDKPTESPFLSPSRLPIDGMPTESPFPSPSPSHLAVEGTPTESPFPSPSPSDTASVILPTASPFPTGPSFVPTDSPAPSPSPSQMPQAIITQQPTDSPAPSPIPTGQTPTDIPTLSPAPSPGPSESPVPSPAPSIAPSLSLSSIPSISRTPSIVPTDSPAPTPVPSERPSQTEWPTTSSNAPSGAPTFSAEPSQTELPSVTKFPSIAPSFSTEPSFTLFPSISPSISESPSETDMPSLTPSLSEAPTS